MPDLSSTPSVSPETLAASIDQLLTDIAALPESERKTAEALVNDIENFHHKGLSSLLQSLAEDPHCASRLREAMAKPEVYAMLRRHNLVKPSAQESVLDALETLRPELAARGSDIALQHIVLPDSVELTWQGEPASAAQLSQIESTLKSACRWLKTVRFSNSPLSQEHQVQIVQIVDPRQQEAH
ncbi:hypothetical protein FHR99_001099 [Litorivivens lipolytica]|uniref:Uncharacterized protein n=1 Tax=Litorivivens lipolytica TaxID=1524264 RepID=A0A7W4Z555_9GAMM|nr:hypothetical protein [Litorivivens lipolytica]MBB3046863.1 hypothetical protein [Litorivivens lipolytica]